VLLILNSPSAVPCLCIAADWQTPRDTP